MSYNPALVDFKHLHFLIMAAPDPTSVKYSIDLLKQHKVTKLVRLCQCNYNNNEFSTAGIDIEDLPFSDGKNPPSDVLKRWIELVNTFNFEPSIIPHISHQSTQGSLQEKNVDPTSPKEEFRIAIHCLAGLGRAPMMVALALINAGAQAGEAIKIIRKARPGALNMHQASYILSYSKRNHSKSCCCIY